MSIFRSSQITIEGPPAPTDTCQPDFNDDGFVDDTDFVTFAQFYDLFTCP